MRDKVTALIAELTASEAVLRAECERHAAAVLAFEGELARVGAAIGPLQALLDTLPVPVGTHPAPIDEDASVPPTEAPDEPPAAFLGKACRVDVASRQPDPFELNQLCIVCEVARFHRNGPRQKVCQECRAMEPRASIEALRALYQQHRVGPPAANQPLASTGIQQACVGPSVDESEPCPLKKQVQRTNLKARGPLRCPDCHLENHRRRVQRRLSVKRAEDRDLQDRITQSAPPALVMDPHAGGLSSDDDELVTVWNGGEGLTRHSGGSSLGGVSSLAVGRMD